MKEVKIVIDGKKCNKNVPTISDYRAYTSYIKEFKGQNLFTEAEAMDGAIGVLLNWFDNEITTEQVEKLGLKDVYEAYKAIEANIAEVFIGVPQGTTEKDKAKTQ